MIIQFSSPLIHFPQQVNVDLLRPLWIACFQCIMNNYLELFTNSLVRHDIWARMSLSIFQKYGQKHNIRWGGTYCLDKIVSEVKFIIRVRFHSRSSEQRHSSWRTVMLNLWAQVLACGKKLLVWDMGTRPPALYISSKPVASLCVQESRQINYFLSVSALCHFLKKNIAEFKHQKLVRYILLF